jgi:selenocysteine lyase/cysteine desulfurase
MTKLELESEIQALRADTPGTAHRIHLNNAGAALMPRPVLDAVLEHLELESEIGGYEAAAARTAEIQDAYREVEGLIGAPRGTVAFVENATAAFVQALSAIPFRSGDLILTTRNDYVSNQIQYLSLEERFGIRVERAPDREEGGADLQAMAELVHRIRPRLVAMTHIPTSSGLVQDPAPIGAVCREKGIPFLVDACQSVGQMPVDVGQLECTFLAATSRKFLRGPRGAGFLYVAEEALDEGITPLFPDLRGADWIEADLMQPAPDARRFENWEFAWALVLGLGAAARYAREVGLERIRSRAWGLAALLRERLDALPGVRALDRGETLGAIVTVEVEGRNPGDLVRRLRREGVNTSSVDRSSAVLDFDEKGVEGALRLSPHYYNTVDEVETGVSILERVLSE